MADLIGVVNDELMMGDGAVGWSMVVIVLSNTCGSGRYPSLGDLRCFAHNLFLNMRKKSRISSDEVV